MPEYWYNVNTHEVEEDAMSDWSQLIGPYKTREEAETFKAAFSRERYVMTMTPVFARRRSMTKKALAQALDAAGWPLQHRPMR